jgi:hypothetical protein
VDLRVGRLGFRVYYMLLQSTGMPGELARSVQAIKLTL